MPRQCIHSPDLFCYICGEFTPKDQRLPVSKFVKQTYNAYFGCRLGDQDKTWAPHTACKPCVEHLRKWSKGESKCLPFGVPMVWREPTNHFSDCYFCMVNVKGFNKKNKHQIEYPCPPSVTRPVPHSDDIPIPNRPTSFSDSEITSDSNSSVDDDIHDAEFIAEDNTAPLLMSQEDLDDLVRDLDLPKESSELLGSRLRERNFLSAGVTYSWYRNREKEFVQFFTLTDDLVFSHNIPGLVAQMGHVYDPKDWRLFIDSSKRSLKAVLLHNGNELASLPVAHSVRMKETYADMQMLMTALHYNDHKWLICGDLKMIAILLGLQSGYTKYPCFLCLWDSRADELHFSKKIWPERTNFTPGHHNQNQIPLVDAQNVLLPPLHIKLGLMKQFVKALNPHGHCFKYLVDKFPQISDAKLKAGIFVGPQIRELMKDHAFKAKMTAVEKRAWTSFQLVVEGFLGNHKAPDYSARITNLVKSYKNLGCRMSVKLHFLHSHLSYFPDNLGAFSEEQGERFHQDICEMERRYQGFWNINMMADYCWSLKRHNVGDHKRKSHKRQFTINTR
jgi:hypothetical protein